MKVCCVWVCEDCHLGERRVKRVELARLISLAGRSAIATATATTAPLVGAAFSVDAVNPDVGLRTGWLSELRLECWPWQPGSNTHLQ